MIGDLHCHTRLSDGSMNLDDVIFYAKRAGLDFIAITDHDTMAGVTRAGIVGKRLGIHVIPGIELSCYDNQRQRSVHILCYMPKSPDRLEAVCFKTLESRNESGQQMIKNVMKYYPITQEHVMRYALGSKAIYKAHIMHAIMDLGYTDKIYGDLFQTLFNRKNGSCYVKSVYPDVYEVVQLCRSAGGVVVMAHPGEFDSIELLRDMASEGLLDGVELYHHKNTAEDLLKIEEIAEAYHLIKFGGTDFHGFYRPQPNPIGTNITPQESLDRLFKLKK